ncbi:MAG: MFS transporter, partial [Bacteroidota bacterium]
MAEKTKKKAAFRELPFTYWIAIIYEFFERGSYYGMMSVLSVYLVDQLGFDKTQVGVIKSTIQPLLYFLPIITGAIADRMGYRKTLMVAFALLGTGYFLTAQATEYLPVFLSLVIMGLGAGTFKPVISGTIAKVTDEETSTLGFGIFYWTINLGAFLFPMFIVPALKSIDWSYVILASAIGTGAMLIPTIFIYKEPPREEHAKEPFMVA